MNYELEDKLRKEFKFYTGFYGRGLPFECGDGWFDLLYELSKGIQELIDSGKEDADFAVHQVKEKYATLRYYCGGMSEETEKLIDIAEAKSEITCEFCGKPGIVRADNGWWTTRCDLCYQTNLIRLGEMFKPQKGKVVAVEDKNAKEALNQPQKEDDL